MAYVQKKTKREASAPEEEWVEEADRWSDAIKYLRLYDKKKELHVFAVNMKNIKEVHEKKRPVSFGDSPRGGSVSPYLLHLQPA